MLGPSHNQRGDAMSRSPRRAGPTCAEPAGCLRAVARSSAGFVRILRDWERVGSDLRLSWEVPFSARSIIIRRWPFSMEKPLCASF